MRRSLPIVLALALLAGCANVTTISTVERDRFTRDQFTLATAEGPLRAIVRNNPFAGDSGDARLMAAVAASSPFPMRLEKAPAGRKFDYRLVVQFGARRYWSTVRGGFVDVCAEDAATEPIVATEALDFVFAFCLGESAIAQANGRLARPVAPDDPGFHRAIGSILAALLLPANQMLEPDNFESARARRSYGR